MPHATMSPEDAVRRLAQLVTANPQITEDGAYTAMTSAGVPPRDADLAYKFTQISWARLVLDGMGVKLADDYYCLNANGDVLETGRLADQPHFIAACRLAPRYRAQPGFKRLAAASADFHAVNQALHDGSRPEDMVIAPPVLFLEPPTDAGMDNAHRLLSQLLPSKRPAATGGTQPPPPPNQQQNTPPPRTDPATNQSWFRKLFRRNPGHRSD